MVQDKKITHLLAGCILKMVIEKHLVTNYGQEWTFAWHFDKLVMFIDGLYLENGAKNAYIFTINNRQEVTRWLSVGTLTFYL